MINKSILSYNKRQLNVVHLRSDYYSKKSLKLASLYCKDNYTRKDVERNIFTNPFKRFEDMRFMKRCREVQYVEFNRHVYKKLTEQEIEWILGHCEERLREYYGR